MHINYVENAEFPFSDFGFSLWINSDISWIYSLPFIIGEKSHFVWRHHKLFREHLVALIVINRIVKLTIKYTFIPPKILGTQCNYSASNWTDFILLLFCSLTRSSYMKNKYLQYNPPIFFKEVWIGQKKHFLKSRLTQRVELALDRLAIIAL